MTRLTLRFALHARQQGGALYLYDVLDGSKVIGSKSVQIDKRVRPWRHTHRYALSDGRDFANVTEFVGAYERQKERVDG
jgi:hypothetical protein